MARKKQRRKKYQQKPLTKFNEILFKFLGVPTLKKRSNYPDKFLDEKYSP